MRTGTDRVRRAGNLLSIACSFALMIGLTAPAGAAIIRVGPTNDYTTIQAAVTAAEAGDTIQVAAGTYAEAVTVNKANLIIQGDGPAATLVPTAGSTPAFVVSANGVTIQGLGITNGTQVVEGIRVSGATAALTVVDVDFVNLGNNPGPGNAYGIQVMNDFSGLTVRGCRFVAANRSVYSRAMGIFAQAGSLLSSFSISGSSFQYFFTGVDIRSEIDGLSVINNIFGPQEVQDCQAAASCIYIGDGPNHKFDVKNITISGNTFTSFARGVYILHYAAGESIGKFDILHNTFTNSIYSSGVRIMTPQGTGSSAMEGPIAVHGNVFVQNQPIANGNGVAMIDLRAGSESLTSQIAITDNEITFNGPFTLSTWGIVLRGPLTQVSITQNTLNGNGAGGASANMPPTAGIVLQCAYPGFAPLSSNAVISVVNNEISSFVSGVVVCDLVTPAYGGLPVGAQLNINYNSITNNSAYGVISGSGETTDATNNWWGAGSGPGIVGPGSGDKVSANVTYVPWLHSRFWPKPDFAITAASGDISPFAPNGSIVGSITVRNTGKVGGYAGRMTYWADWDWDWEMLISDPNGDAGGDLGWMDAGETIVIPLNGLGLKAASTYGTHTLLFFVDSNQDMDESSEGNNLVSYTYHFTGSDSNYKNLPDFAVTNITLDPVSPLPGSTFTAHVTVVNNGVVAGNAGTLSVWVSHAGRITNGESDVATSSTAVDTLAAGASVTKSFTVTAPTLASGRTHHFKTFIDSAFGAAETSEGNNQKSTTYHYPW